MADFRVILVAGGALLAGCSASGPEQAEAAAQSDNVISCAIGSASQFTPNCSVERSIEDGTLYLIIHHEDGGFRRLRVMSDGSGVLAADGADDARITVFDGEIEVAVGNDRYVLPATIADNGAE